MKRENINVAGASERAPPCTSLPAPLLSVFCSRLALNSFGRGGHPEVVDKVNSV